MALDTMLHAASNPHFQNRVYMAMLVAAAEIRSEDPSTPDHENRVLFGARVMNSTPHAFQSNAQTFAWACAVAAQGIDDTATDAKISSTVASIWNAWAG